MTLWFFHLSFINTCQHLVFSMSLADDTGAVPVHCSAASPKCSPSAYLWRINLGVCDTVSLTLHKRCGIQSRIGTPKCLYPGTVIGSSSCGGQLPAPSWTVCELCSLIAVWKPVLWDNLVWEGWFSSFPRAGICMAFFWKGWGIYRS